MIATGDKCLSDCYTNSRKAKEMKTDLTVGGSYSVVESWHARSRQEKGDRLKRKIQDSVVSHEFTYLPTDKTLRNAWNLRCSCTSAGKHLLGPAIILRLNTTAYEDDIPTSWILPLAKGWRLPLVVSPPKVVVLRQTWRYETGYGTVSYPTRLELCLAISCY